MWAREGAAEANSEGLSSQNRNLMGVYKTEDISSRAAGRETSERDGGNGNAGGACGTARSPPRMCMYPARFIFRIDLLFNVTSGGPASGCVVAWACLYSPRRVIERHYEGKQSRPEREEAGRKRGE